ncbi:MAG: hypothetical protein KC635_02305 [Myxococcales bacterium]|nr:hypothetical protein [Myxococcales bacterium]MCB9731474.1 hypothetical protein [Deltaproteobacteria bacterium]
MDDKVDSALPMDAPAAPSEAGDERRPYEPPVVESGVAFEKVLMLSGCNSGFFCPIPCS